MPFWRRLHPLVWAVVVGIVVLRFGGSMCLPFLTLFLTGKGNLSPFEAGFVLAAGSLAGMVAGFWGGAISDHLGRRPVVVVSGVLAVVALAAFAWATSLEGVGLVGIVFSLLNAALSVVSGTFETAAQALIGDFSTRENRSFAYSLRYFGANLGHSLGPLVGAALGFSASGQGFAVAAVCYGVVVGCLSLLLWRYEPPARPAAARLRWAQVLGVLARDKVLLSFVLGGALIHLAYVQIGSTLAPAMKNAVPDGIVGYSLVVSLNGIVVLLAQWPLQWISSRWSTPLKAISLGVVVMASGFALFAAAGASLGWYVVGMVLLTLGEILVVPQSQIYLDTLAPEALRGSYFGAANFRSLGSVAGPVAGGFLLTQTGPAWTFVAVTIFCLLSLPFFRVRL